MVRDRITPRGPISDLHDIPTTRADFVYMAPPFIAYYGALAGGSAESTLLQLAFDQCRLYRNYLRDDGGLWRHIVLGTGEDARHWGTGTIHSLTGKWICIDMREWFSLCRERVGCRWHVSRAGNYQALEPAFPHGGAASELDIVDSGDIGSVVAASGPYCRHNALPHFELTARF